MKLLLTALVALLVTYGAQAQLKINEVLYDPSNTALAGDANGDGVYDQVQDEFIEFVNTSPNTLDVSKVKIYDFVISSGLKTLRHTVPNGLTVPGRGALVVFGGGTATGTFGGAVVVVDLGTAGLSLGNSGEVIIVEDSLGNVLDSLNTDALSDNPNESYTRNPDFTGAYVQHASVRAGVLFSPGVMTTGMPFNTTNLVRTSASRAAMRIAPNPTTGQIQLEGNLANGQTLNVYSPIGSLVSQKALVANSADLSDLANGVYYLLLDGVQDRAATKIVVQK
jgi:hypothetical protein